MSARFILLLWPVIDRLLVMLYDIKPLRANGSGIICLEFRRYNGCGVKLSDGCKVKTGDKIVELHLNSAWFRRRRKLGLTTLSWRWEALRYLAEDLALLAQQMLSGSFSDIKALHGTTLLHTGARRLGFQVNDLPDTLWKKCTQFYLAGLMQIHHLGKGERFKTTDKPLELKEVWLSRSALITKYGSRHS